MSKQPEIVPVAIGTLVRLAEKGLIMSLLAGKMVKVEGTIVMFEQYPQYKTFLLAGRATGKSIRVIYTGAVKEPNFQQGSDVVVIGTIVQVNLTGTPEYAIQAEIIKPAY